jgi:hypothetical protein
MQLAEKAQRPSNGEELLEKPKKRQNAKNKKRENASHDRVTLFDES